MNISEDQYEDILKSGKVALSAGIHHLRVVAQRQRCAMQQAVNTLHKEANDPLL